MTKETKRVLVRVCLILAALCAAAPSYAQQNAPSVDEIVNKLRPAAGPAAGTAPGLSFRGVRIEQQPDAPAQPPQPAAAPSIDLSVNFEFGSARLSVDSRIVLDNLGRALNDPSLKPYRFVVAGHTDAKGRPEVNMRLSEARARSVTTYLVREHGIAPDRLVAKGFGATQLLYKDDPDNALNRRVQITTQGPNT
jgi:outer membrane protein OmpA-like peptidoglycan-associated protein